MSKLITAPVLIFLAVLALVYFVLPKQSEVSNLEKQFKTKETELAEKQAYYFDLKKSQEELEIYSQSIASIEAALPQGLSLAALLDYFQGQALASGLILKNIGQASPGIETETESKIQSRLSKAYFVVIVQGSVPALEDFLKKVEKSARIIEVEDIVLKAGEIELPELTLQAKVYYY